MTDLVPVAPATVAAPVQSAEEGMPLDPVDVPCLCCYADQGEPCSFSDRPAAFTCSARYVTAELKARDAL